MINIDFVEESTSLQTFAEYFSRNMVLYLPNDILNIILNEIYSAWDAKTDLDMIFADIQKAYDSIWINALIFKLCNQCSKLSIDLVINIYKLIL